MTYRVPTGPSARGRDRSAAWTRAAVWALALLALAGCGLKTPPRPLEEVLKPTLGLEARQRGDSVLVTWLAPDGDVQKRFGPPKGYVLLVQALPLLCLACLPPSPERLRLAPDAPELLVRSERLYYPLEFPREAGRLRIQVRTVFSAGTTPVGSAVLVERGDVVPTPRLNWRWVDASASRAATARTVLFFWDSIQEYVVQVIGADGQPRERVEHYRANLYRRIPPEPWPLQPLNPMPLEATQWIVPPLQVEYPPGAPGEAYALRYVDRFGNEGPASPDVLIPLAERRR